jgi:hypothetical protein
MSLSLTKDNSCPAPGPYAQDIPGMAATLASYDHMFGPHHPQTLSLMSQLGRALWRAGDAERGRKLLERAAKKLSKRQPRAHPARILALSALGELLFERGDFSGACVMQREVLACRMETGGPDHPDTIAAEGNLAGTLNQLARWAPAGS